MINENSSPYLKIVTRFKNLVIQPNKECPEILLVNEEMNDTLTTYILPLIGFASIATFFKHTLYPNEFIWDFALKNAAITFIAYFVGLMSAFYVIKLFSRTNSHSIFSLAAYSSGFIYIIGIVTELIPDLYIFYILSLYNLVVVWNFTFLIFKENSHQLKVIYFIVFSVCINVFPEVISRILYFFTKL